MCSVLLEMRSDSASSQIVGNRDQVSSTQPRRNMYSGRFRAAVKEAARASSQSSPIITMNYGEAEHVGHNADARRCVWDGGYPEDEGADEKEPAQGGGDGRGA